MSREVDGQGIRMTKGRNILTGEDRKRLESSCSAESNWQILAAEIKSVIAETPVTPIRRF
jgi:hypothetical protein